MMLNLLKDLLLIGCAGALGTITRYLMTLFTHKMMGEYWPWGMLAVNITGAFLAGAVWMALELRTEWRYIGSTLILIGFLGAFTTFSSVMLESGKMFRAGEMWQAFGHILVQNVTGLGAALLGIWLISKLFR